MTFDEAQSEFAIRYYRWAREEFRREVEQEFPVLKKLKTRPSSLCLHWMARLSRENQFKFAEGLAKRFNREALQTTGESLDDWQTQMIKRYTDSYVALPDPRDVRPDIGAGKLKSRRKGVLALVKRHVTQVLQQHPENCGGGTWRYTNPIGLLQLETHFDFGGRSRLVEYSHTVVFTRYHFLVHLASIQSWLGLGGATSWTALDIEESEEDEIARLIAELCAHFLNAAPILVEGLSL